jgi:hypothetical protein
MDALSFIKRTNEKTKDKVLDNDIQDFIVELKVASTLSCTNSSDYTHLPSFIREVTLIDNMLQFENTKIFQRIKELSFQQMLTIKCMLNCNIDIFHKKKYDKHLPNFREIAMSFISFLRHL